MITSLHLFWMQLRELLKTGEQREKATKKCCVKILVFTETFEGKRIDQVDADVLYFSYRVIIGINWKAACMDLWVEGA